MSKPYAKIVIRVKPEYPRFRYARSEGEILVELKTNMGTVCLDHLHYVNAKRCGNSRARTIETIRCRAKAWAACLGLELHNRIVESTRAKMKKESP